VWRIYYDDGSFFDSSDGLWESAPLDGVICVVWQHDGRTEFISGGDHYARFEDGTIAVVDLEPFLRGPHLAPGVLKFGRMTSHKKHEAIMSRARADFIR
jgi:hypothetical protein